MATDLREGRLRWRRRLVLLACLSARQCDLPLRQQRTGFDNYSDGPELTRRTTANRCLAAAELPLYEIDSVRTGQVDSENGQTIWSARIDGRAPRPDASGTSDELPL